MAKRMILIVEDDPAIRQGMRDALRFAGFDTIEAEDGPAGLDAAVRAEYDLLLLDLVLPGCDGLKILEALRAVRPTLPVIILTARGEESDRVQGLELGADDYVVKPFSVKELLARIEAVLRRSPERPVDLKEVRFPGGAADLERHEVRFDDGTTAMLTDRERELLRYLAMHSGRAVSREEILARVWRIESHGGMETRTIDMHIAGLRAKLKDDSSGPRIILTVRGKGYMFARPEVK